MSYFIVVKVNMAEEDVVGNIEFIDKFDTYEQASDYIQLVRSDTGAGKRRRKYIEDFIDYHPLAVTDLERWRNLYQSILAAKPNSALSVPDIKSWIVFKLLSPFIGHIQLEGYNPPAVYYWEDLRIVEVNK